MAGSNLLVFLKDSSPDLNIDYFEDLLEPFRQDESLNRLGHFIWITDFASIWNGRYCFQKKELLNLFDIFPAFYNLDSQWIEWDYKSEAFSDWEQKLLKYFNSVPDDTWLYSLYLHI